MPVHTEIRPTTSLPLVQITTEQLQGLPISDQQKAALIQAASAISHVLRHGNATLLELLADPSRPVTDAVSLDDLDAVLTDPSAVETVRNYAGLTFSEGVITHCREAISRLRLYWLTYDTLRWIDDRVDDLSLIQLNMALQAARHIGEQLERNDNKTITEWLAANDGGGRQRDPGNDRCLVVNHLELLRIVNDQYGILQGVFFGSPPVEGVDELELFVDQLRLLT